MEAKAVEAHKAQIAVLDGLIAVIDGIIKPKGETK
jgi:hypothetical protein